VWFQKYFATFGDCAPNRFETYLIITARRNVYNQYVEEFKKHNRPIVQESVFSNLWNTIFPRYINRPWCDIPGKCDTCYEIDSQRRSSQDTDTQEQLKVAHHLHRGGMFNLERLRYKRRCAEAIRSNNSYRPTVMSLIIDGMDQNHCKVPYLGGQDTFKDSIKQHITGVKEHGVGLTLFRTFNNVRKSANLTIYCILKKLEDFRKRHGYYPEKLFVQVDGGSENANQYVLSAMELLVIKRCCREVFFTRLPTGHTHEDIDAAFAVIWSCFTAEHCETLQAYKDRIEKAFSSTSLNASIEDIYAIPDYQSVLSDCIIKGFSRMHKEIQTQHQWRFLAVPVDDLFPFGCKTTFRAYSADQVVEFVKKPKAQCLSKVGRYTGLEPVTLYCRWYPTRECDMNRPGIEGLYLLTKLPTCNVSIGSVMTPCAFEPGSCKEMKDCVVEVHRRWQTSDTRANIITSWDTWAREFAPINDDALQYVADQRTRKHFKMPMRNILFRADQYISSSMWMANIGAYSDFDPNFKWPELIAIATNSVASDQFNPRPLVPRIYSVLDDQILLKKQYFQDESAVHYEVKLNRELATSLKAILRRRVGYSGEEPSLSGSKLELVRRIKDDHLLFVILMSRSLPPPDLEYVDSVFRADVTVPEVANKIIAQIETTGGQQVKINTKLIHELKLASPLSTDLMEGIWKLFEKRDLRIANAHRDVNSETQSYVRFKRSLFINDCFIRALEENPEDPNLMENFFTQGIDFLSTHRLYCIDKPIIDDTTNDNYALVILDFDRKSIHHLLPSWIPEDTVVSERTTLLCNLLNRFLDVFMGPGIRGLAWKVSNSFASMKFPPNQTDFDTGIYVFLFTYYAVNDCPIIFDASDVIRMRKILTHWILNEYLPA